MVIHPSQAPLFLFSSHMPLTLARCCAHSFPPVTCAQLWLPKNSMACFFSCQVLTVLKAHPRASSFLLLSLHISSYTQNMLTHRSYTADKSGCCIYPSSVFSSYICLLFGFNLLIPMWLARDRVYLLKILYRLFSKVSNFKLFAHWKVRHKSILDKNTMY